MTTMRWICNKGPKQDAQSKGLVFCSALRTCQRPQRLLGPVRKSAHQRYPYIHATLTRVCGRDHPHVHASSPLKLYMWSTSVSCCCPVSSRSTCPIRGEQCQSSDHLTTSRSLCFSNSRVIAFRQGATLISRRQESPAAWCDSGQPGGLQLQHVTRMALLALHIVENRYVRRMQHASSSRQQQHDSSPCSSRVNTVEWITSSEMIDAEEKHCGHATSVLSDLD
jgi:hypothetical protein